MVMRFADDVADGVQPQQPEGTRHSGHPPPPGSSPAFVASTRNFDSQRRAAGSVDSGYDEQPPAVDSADAGQLMRSSVTTSAAANEMVELCDADDGTGGDGAHWRASPQT